MRIAFTVHKFPPESLGGVEIYAEGLARTLAGTGHDVHVFYPSFAAPSEGRLDGPDGVHLWRVPLPASRTSEGPVPQFWHTFRDLGIEAAFRRFLAAVRPEIVHFQHVQGFSARLISLAKGRPRVVTLHDYWFFCMNSQLIRPDQAMCGGPRLGWNCVDCATVRPDLRSFRRLRPALALLLAYRNGYLRRVVRSVDMFISPSEFLRGRYITQGFPAERILTLENGLDAARLCERTDFVSPKLEGRPHFGFIGALAWHKGVHVLIEAFNRMPADATLTIYGNEGAFPEYVARLKAEITHPNIRFAGVLDRGYVGTAMRQLDCLVVPSIWYENSPLVIQEAFAVGLPVVASRLGALPEKVHDGITGRLFTPGASAELADVLQTLIIHPEHLAEFRRNIRPGPDIQEHAALMLDIYRRLRQGLPGVPTENARTSSCPSVSA
jgi:glycosyltransferase involved in cell wall biosynthesis